jgi:signal transduction histidine kinase
MTTPDPMIMAKLKAHRALAEVPLAEHEWLATHGTLTHAPVGAVLGQKGIPIDQVYIIFAGAVVVRSSRETGSHKIYEMSAGTVGGKLPFSRMVAPPANVVVENDALEYLALAKECVPDLIRNCPVTTGAMVHAMIDRARQFKISDLHDEKLISLGKLAAGLAHELGNPSSAAVRSSKQLAKSIDAAESAAVALGEASLTAEQWKAIRGAISDCGATSEFATASAIARADRLDEITDWLDGHGVDAACADPLAETGITIDALDRLADKVPAEALKPAVRWIAAGCGLRSLAYELDMASARMQQLVTSVKGFTFMDHSPTPEPLDIRAGIQDTFTMLAAKKRAKDVDVAMRLPESLPKVLAVGGELNQVWMNLIDNAIDAVSNGGHITIESSVSPGKLTVCITDDGPGIPAEIQGRIFDPFFTTKEVGKGTGLGLDIVRRIIQRHDGALDLESRPGRTQFRVRLPTAAIDG